MEPLIIVIICLIGTLFLLKSLFLITTGWVLPVTQGALFIPSSRINIETFLGALPMHPQEFFVDLGCGDGRVLREVHRRYKVRALGIEINPLAYAAAKILTVGLRGVRIKRRNFLEEALGSADVVFCYLFPDILEELAEKLTKELQPGARVVSCNFPLPRWTPLKVIRPDPELNGDPIYIYEFPGSRPRGGKQLSLGGRPVEPGDSKEENVQL
jgi:SAM-dependent methyltransferase